MPLSECKGRMIFWLCYIFLLHQTTTPNSLLTSAISCVISFFYIKPQRMVSVEDILKVVLYLTSTSNHNKNKDCPHLNELCYILLLHQTTTVSFKRLPRNLLCYILLLHQTTTVQSVRLAANLLCYILLLHQTTTMSKWSKYSVRLCYILLLHQTTTQGTSPYETLGLCYILLLHQTTTRPSVEEIKTCCVISFFYIKPQQGIA